MPKTNETARRNTITSSRKHRALLIGAMEALVEGRMSVPVANALSALSSEVHKSIRQEWDMICYSAENFALGKGNEILILSEED